MTALMFAAFVDMMGLLLVVPSPIRRHAAGARGGFAVARWWRRSPWRSS